jgi:hypothetical protein
MVLLCMSTIVVLHDASCHHSVLQMHESEMQDTQDHDLDCETIQSERAQAVTFAASLISPRMMQNR